jgi:hypothetical protein
VLFEEAMQKALMLVALSTTLTACPRRDSDLDIEEAEIASDSNQLSQVEGSLLASLADGAPTASVAPATPDGVAAYIAANAPRRFLPAGCATATQNGASVVIVFDNCTGPRGLRTVDGTLDVTASSAGSAIALTASATNFHVGRATMDIDASATYTAGSLAVSTTSSGTGPFGREITHDGDYTLTWTPTCVAIDGAWSTSGADRMRSTTADLQRCLDECPSGEIARTTVDGRVITLAFDGTPTVHWSTSKGRSGTFELIGCGL